MWLFKAKYLIGILQTYVAYISIFSIPSQRPRVFQINCGFNAGQIIAVQR